MATWIELHTTLPGHRKLVRLSDVLRIDRMQAMGHLVSLWLWAIDQAEDGDLTGYGDQDIADAARWHGRPGRFAEALATTGWLDVAADRRALHDWSDYAGSLVLYRQRERDRKRRERAAVSAGQSAGQSNGHKPDSPRPVRRTVPDRTVPDRTAPDPEPPNPRLATVERERAQRARSGSRRQRDVAALEAERADMPADQRYLGKYAGRVKK